MNETKGFMERLSVRLRACRAFTFPISMLPVIIATAAVLPPSEWKWLVLVASTLGAGLLHGAGNLFNDFYDLKYGVDRRVEGDEKRIGRVLVRGELKPGQVLRQGILFLLISLGLFVYLLTQCGAGLLWFGLIAAFFIYTYTGPPLHLKYHALGELVIFFVFGPSLMAGAAYAQTGHLELNALLLSIPVGFATTAVLVGNNIRDFEEDGEAGIKTIAQVANAKPARALYIFLVVAATLALSVMSVVGVVPLLLAVSPLLLVLLKEALQAVKRGERMADIDAQTAKFESILLIFVLVTLLVAGPKSVDHKAQKTEGMANAEKVIEGETAAEIPADVSA